jgi:putative two-component system response regulator
MALADVFDALCSKRVYKQVFEFESAAAIIHGGRGTHFDPDLVDAFAARAADFRRVAVEMLDAGP